MSNSQTKIDSITLLRQKVGNLLKNSSSRSELILPKLETLKLLDEIEVQQVELKSKEHLYDLFPNGCFERTGI